MIPYRLFDGGWTGEHRTRLAAQALARIEKAAPGTLAILAAVKIIAPPDIESGLAATGGDLDGGALAPDQMLGLRPGPRTALKSFYLGGRSAQAGPLGTGAAGFAAAAALMADGAP
jgi:phytoene dehydrogenase-like protein